MNPGHTVLMDTRRLREGTGIARAIAAWKERAERDQAAVRFLTTAEVVDRSPWPTEPRGISRAVRAAQADLFHSTYPHTLLPRGVPTLFSLFDVIQLTAGFPKRTLARALIGRNVGLAQRVLTISTAAAHAIETAFGVPRERIDIVPCGVDAPADMPRPELGDHLLYVGNCKPHKNIGPLLEWCAELLPPLGLRLIAVVPPACREELEAQPARGVTLVSRLAAQELEHLRASAVGAVSLARDEGFGLPPLEAAVHGTPSVLLDAGAHREVMQDGARYCGLDKASFGVALQELVAERDALSTKARARATELSWDNSWRALEDSYARTVREVRET